MDENEIKKQALLKMLQGPSGPKDPANVIFGKDQAHPPWKQWAENIGISGANISDLIPGVYNPANAKYQGGGASERLLGIPSPATGQPDLMRAHGPLDPTASELAGSVAEMVTDPRTYVPAGKLGAGIKNVAKEFPATSKIIKGTPISHELSDANEFTKAVNLARDSSPLHAQNITAYSPEEYSKMQTYLSPDKKSGYAIKPDGELVSVFSTEKGRGNDLVSQAVQNGAKHLDAYDIGGKLPDLYGKHGFQEVKREPNWTPGGPDVVYMRKPDIQPVDLEKTSPNLLSLDEIQARAKANGVQDNINNEIKEMYTPNIAEDDKMSGIPLMTSEEQQNIFKSKNMTLPDELKGPAFYGPQPQGEGTQPNFDNIRKLFKKTGDID